MRLKSYILPKKAPQTTQSSHFLKTGAGFKLFNKEKKAWFSLKVYSEWLNE